MPNGIIVQGRGGLYTVADDRTGEEFILRARKIFRRAHLQPLVGDKVLYTPGLQKDEHGWISEILPRNNQLIRPPVSNISLMLILIASVPEPDFGLVDRLLVIAARKDIKPMIVVTKADLDFGLLYDKTRKTYAGTGCAVVRVAMGCDDDIDRLKLKLNHEFACLCGQSGVGKSTLLNRLLHLNTETGQLSERIERGKNTTRHTQLFHAGNCYLFDTPGFTLLEEDVTEDPVSLQKMYPEFQPYLGKCRFNPCYHDKEPGCAIKALVGKEVHPDRYRRYLDLLHHDMDIWKDRYRK